MLNTSLTFFSSKLDSPVIKTLERIRFFSNQNVGEMRLDHSCYCKRMVQALGSFNIILNNFQLLEQKKVKDVAGVYNKIIKA